MFHVMLEIIKESLEAVLALRNNLFIRPCCNYNKPSGVEQEIDQTQIPIGYMKHQFAYLATPIVRQG
jgi:CTP:phosphocholine cytidylyltransferase-like protein